MKTIVIIPLFFVLLFFSTSSFAQQADRPETAFELDLDDISKRLLAAPDFSDKNAHINGPVIELPLPDGQMKTFRLFKTHPMHPELAAKYPEIQTYHGKCWEDGVSAAAVTISPKGLSAFILDKDFKRIYVEPIDAGDRNQYTSFFEPNNLLEDYMCPFEGHEAKAIPGFLPKKKEIPAADASSRMMINNQLALGDKLRTHRLALTCTGEYAVQQGGTVASVNAVLAANVNALNLIYIREASIQFQIVANNDQLLYFDGTTDPYLNDGNPSPDLDNAHNTITSTIGSGAFDIGHLMQDPTACPTCGGWAGVGVPCNDTGKGKGMSTQSLAVLMHEMGHQFNCQHTTDFLPTRYDHIAIGNTIMGRGSVPGNSDYFHITSADSIARHVEQAGYCVPGVNTNNSIPMVTVGNGGMTIPSGTPFQLTGSATDPDPNTTLLYNWQQYNSGDTYNVVNNEITPVGDVPMFRNYFPTPNGNVRTIPRLSALVNNVTETNASGNNFMKVEGLPTYTRSLTFRLVARDFEMTGGAFDYGEITFGVDGNSGPFVVGTPNNGTEVWTAGTNVNVGWNVASTNIAPVNCATVDILLSLDGGFNYPITLASGTANDGSHTFTLPAGIPASTTARVRVESTTHDNVVFFDISNNDFTINSACKAVGGIVAPADDVTATTGAAALDLNPAPLFGFAVPSATITVTAADNTGRFALLDVDMATCTVGCCDGKYDSHTFQVDKTGNYTFAVSSPDPSLGWFSLYAGSYIPTPGTEACTNFITSNRYEAGGGSVGGSPTISADLVPGVTYVMVYHPWFEDNGICTVNFSSSAGGTVVLTSLGSTAPSPAGDYSYTYAAVNTATGQIAAINAGADFTGLTTAGTYHVYGMSYKSANPPPAVVDPNTFLNLTIEAAINSNQCIAFSSNFIKLVVEPGSCTPPNITAPTVTQPTCPAQVGTIVVNATGNGVLQYSVNNGANWQASNTFPNLAAGNYNLRVRLAADPACIANYGNNPVVLNPAVGCGGCNTYASTNVPVNITAVGTPTVTSTLNVPTTGTITDIKVIGLDIDHTYINDLTVKLKGPDNTEITLLTGICGSQSNILIDFDDASANAYGSIPCPPNGGSYQPNQALSAFDGKAPNGTWTLTIEDAFNQDGGNLMAWSLEVCTSGGGNCPNTLTVQNNIATGNYQASQSLTAEGTITNGATVTLRGGTEVTLSPNFEVQLGGILDAIIGACTN